MTLSLLLLLAFLPGLAIALYIYLRDLKEPEPYALLLLSLIYGAAAFMISRGIGFLLHNFIYINQEDVLHQLLSAFLFVGLLGEGFKFLFLRGIIFYYKHFNQPFDGIVYAIMVGMGYAIADNVLHVISGDTEAATLRMITASPANAVFAVIMGYFLGEAKRINAQNITLSLVALLLAAIAHGYYDYFMTLAHINALWLQALISIAIVIVLTQMALKSRKNSLIK